MISEERCFSQPQACGEVWRDIGRKNCTKDLAQTCCCSCESCEKKHSQRKTPYLQAQKSQWSSEHKELRGASAASESCLQRVLGWCRILLGSSQRSDSEVETREAHRFCRWLPGAAKSSWSCQDSKFERCCPSPLHMDAAGHPPQKRWPKTMWHCCANWCKMGWQKKNKTVSYWQPVTMWLKVWQMSRKDSWDGWASCQPLRVVRSSTAICYARTTWTRSLAWNAFFEL